ncbi:hypothetical protein ACFFX0_31365 [Citricoccus parietis]|uniref:Uncharacterized protein n=1 Tax=Citricoccus parietis TaxID=592307 RepID=A0ABV5G902_9MICC
MALRLRRRGLGHVPGPVVAHQSSGRCRDGTIGDGPRSGLAVPARHRVGVPPAVADHPPDPAR